MPSTAWIISNRQPYGEEINCPDSLLMADPALLGRLETTPTKDQSCSITRLGPGACAETASAAGRVMRHLETVLERRLEVLVVDFTKDDRGRVWFLQVFLKVKKNQTLQISPPNAFFFDAIYYTGGCRFTMVYKI